MGGSGVGWCGGVGGIYGCVGGSGGGVKQKPIVLDSTFIPTDASFFLRCVCVCVTCMHVCVCVFKVYTWQMNIKCT